MRLFFFMIALSIHATAFAMNARTTESFERPSLFDLADFQDALQTEGYWSVDVQNTGAAAVIGVDQIFTDSSLDETIYLKLGLQQFEPSSFNAVADGVAFQGRTSTGEPYVLFFENIPMARAKEIAKRIDNPQASRGRPSRMDVALRLMIPRAAAATTCAPGSLQRQVAGTLDDLDGILGFRALASCAMTVLKSAAQTVASPFESLYKLVNDPKKFWNDTKQEWRRLKGFVLNVRSELTSFFQTLGNLDADILREIACSTIGQVAASVGMTLLTAGAGAGAIARTSAALTAMIAKLNRLKDVLQTMSRMKQLGRLPSMTGAARKVMSCAVH